MSKGLYKKGLVLAVICLFIGTVVVPGIKTNENIYEEDCWIMYKHDLCHTGFSNCSIPDKLGIIFTMENKYYSTPVFCDDKAYMGNYSGFYCFDIENWNVIWSNLNVESPLSSAALADGRIYFGADYHDWEGPHARFHCLDANTGEEIWNYTTVYATSASPAVYENRVYFGCLDGRIRCFNAETGEYIWGFNTGKPVGTSPAIYYNKIYIGCDDENMKCLDLDTGNFVWQYASGNKIRSSPMIFDEKVYFGNNDGFFYCLNSLNGEIIWSYETSGAIYQCSALFDGKVYIGNNQNEVFCFNAYTGELIWNFQTEDPDGWTGDPVIADGMLFIGSENFLYGLDLYNGDLKWEYESITDSINPDPVIYNDMLYTNLDSGFCCLGEINNVPPNKPSVSYDKAHDTLIISATDSDSTQVRYGVSWNNDYTVDQWTNLVASGTQESISCEGRTGKVGVIAEDEDGAQSDWVSQTPKNKAINPFMPLLERLIERFPILEQILQQFNII